MPPDVSAHPRRQQYVRVTWYSSTPKSFMQKIGEHLVPRTFMPLWNPKVQSRVHRPGITTDSASLLSKLYIHILQILRISFSLYVITYLLTYLLTP